MDTANTYAERFKALVESFRNDLGQADLPFYYVQLSRVIGPQSRSGWNKVQEAQRLFEKENPATGMVAGIDLTLTDSIHLDAASLAVIGRRLASRILDGPGPDLVSATWDSPQRLRLKFSRRLKHTGDRIHGFELNIPAVFHTSQDPKTGDIILHVAVPGKETNPLELFHGRGTNPICNLTDERGLALPVFGPVSIAPK
jgi:sialate O-acetylesterase